MRCEGQSGSSQFLNDGFQQALARWNRSRLSPAFPTADWSRVLDEDIGAASRRCLRRGNRATSQLAPPMAPQDVEGSSPGSKAQGNRHGAKMFLCSVAGGGPRASSDFHYFLGQEAAGRGWFRGSDALAR
jgi:hypothetical protein